jgi:hypothetical protein
MVTDAILDFFFGFLEATLILLPDGSALVPPDAPALTVLAAANVVLPIDILLNTMGFAVGVMTVGLAYWGVMKGINLIRGSGA